MKKFLFLIFILAASSGWAQITPFRFAFLSDTHIGSPNGAAEQDLRRSVQDINAMSDVAFVVITGDITELGTNRELSTARSILDSLDVPYHVIPGNHDTGWSESGGLGFTATFGYDKFVFDHGGIRFIACASGPYVRMSDGHVPRGAIVWMDSVLAATPQEMPVIFLNHYPLDKGLDNWYEVTDRLRDHNTIAVLCGHGHRNRELNFEGLAATMGRSNLRARAKIGGYNLVDVRTDSIIFSERTPGVETLPAWRKIKIERPDAAADTAYERPPYDINDRYSEVKRTWTFSSDANVISTPVVTNDLAIFGDQSGKVRALSIRDGSVAWSMETGSPIFSSPAAAGNRVVFGSTDGNIYCVNSQDGKVMWKHTTRAAVLGCPLIEKNTVYIGGSDGSFRKLDLRTGKEIWSFNGLQGPVVSTPLMYEDQVIFGAWDRHLYAVDKKTGRLNWKWNNGSSVRNYSPASCIPVAHDGIVYIVAPDRYITAIDASTGKTMWRNNDATVRESIGISADGKFVYGKTMQDTVVAFATSAYPQTPAWKMNCGFGYEHVPSMLIEKDGLVFFGTKSGVVYAIDPREKVVSWAHKIDNSMVNTVRAIRGDKLVVSTMDGKVVLLETTP